MRCHSLSDSADDCIDLLKCKALLYCEACAEAQAVTNTTQGRYGIICVSQFVSFLFSSQSPIYVSIPATFLFPSTCCKDVVSIDIYKFDIKFFTDWIWVTKPVTSHAGVLLGIWWNSRSFGRAGSWIKPIKWKKQSRKRFLALPIPETQMRTAGGKPGDCFGCWTLFLSSNSGVAFEWIDVFSFFFLRWIEVMVI